MKQALDTDEVSLVVAAPPEAVWPLVADVTRMPELSPLIARVEWLDGATEAAVGARFKAVNTVGRGPDWSNRPVITVVDAPREIAWERSEPFAGTLEWRYRLDPVDGGTRVTESYRVVRPVTRLGWFVIGTLYGVKDDRALLRQGMLDTLERLRELAEQTSA